MVTTELCLHRFSAVQPGAPFEGFADGPGSRGLDCTEEGKDRGEGGIHGLHGGTVVRI